MSSNGVFLFVGSAFVADDETRQHAYTSLMNDLRDRFDIYGRGQNLGILPADQTKLAEETMPNLGHNCTHIEDMLHTEQYLFEGTTGLIRSTIEQMHGIREICAQHDIIVYYMNEFDVVEDQHDLDTGIEEGYIVELTEEAIDAWAARVNDTIG